jgi:virulence factor Mce-like protein
MRADHRTRMRLVGLAFVAGVLLLIVIVFSGIFRGPFEPGSFTVTADFERAPQLHKGDQVRLQGNIKGKVTDVEPAPVPEGARVTMAVDRDAGEVYADARARLRVKTLLGGAFYVDLEPGTPGAGPLGHHVITLDRTSVQTEVEDITDIFRADAVTGLKTLPGELATGLSNPAPPVAAIKTLDAVAHDAAVGVDALRGSSPGQDLPRLVHSTANAVAALDTPTDDIRTVVAGAAATFRTTGRRSAEIRQTLHAGPGVTYDMAHTLVRLDSTLGIARGLIHRLDRGVPQIAPTLKALRPTLPLAADTLENAKPVLREAGDTTAALAQLGPQLKTLLDGVDPGLKRASKTILPYLGRKDPITGYTTSTMIGGFGAGFGGIATQMDQNGHFVRFPAAVGPSSSYIPCTSSLIDPSAPSQLACDSLNTAVKTYLSYLPPGYLDPAAPKDGKR